jgi:hypothetical protein
MNLVNVSLIGTAVVVILSQDWISQVKAWIQAKVRETQVGQTQT